MTPSRSQVWNEPSLLPYWSSGPNPREYTRLLAAASRAIHRVDPRAVVVSAGIPQGERGDRFLSGMYRAGAPRYYDMLALHLYKPDERSTLRAALAVRRTMRSHRDRSPLWITELGWPSGGPRDPRRVSEPRHAQLLERTLLTVKAHRTRLGLRGVVVYNWKDGRPYAPYFKDYWGLHTGLLRRDGSAKPALAAVRRASRALP